MDTNIRIEPSMLIRNVDEMVNTANRMELFILRRKKGNADVIPDGNDDVFRSLGFKVKPTDDWLP